MRNIYICMCVMIFLGLPLAVVLELQRCKGVLAEEQGRPTAMHEGIATW